VRYVKGHGTGNDFVLLPDPEGVLPLTTGLVRALCDRHTGVGGDGVLRVVRSARDPAAAAMAGQAMWFMDYRNADGSLAEMCGNGVRVFARYLMTAGLAAPGVIPVATRGGVVSVRPHTDGDADGDADRDADRDAGGELTADMGRYGLPDLGDVRVRVGEHEWPAVAVTMPNPHAVLAVDDLAAAGALTEAPQVTPGGAYPDGVNVEFVRQLGERALAMRVHERGSGETRSCGTGVCAAAVATALRTAAPAPSTWTVDVPGGRQRVQLCTDGRVLLTGPAVLVAEGELDAGWLAEAGGAANAGAT